MHFYLHESFPTTNLHIEFPSHHQKSLGFGLQRMHFQTKSLIEYYHHNEFRLLQSICLVQLYGYSLLQKMMTPYTHQFASNEKYRW